MGAAALFVINLVRIISLFYIGSAYPDFLDLAHFFLWQLFMIVLTIGLWLLWTVKIVHTHKEGSNPAHEVDHR